MGSNAETIDGWEVRSREARINSTPLRAPQPKASTPVVPKPPLSAPQPKESTKAKPLNAPQPFSNAPEADIDGTERRFVRTASISTNHRRKSTSTNIRNRTNNNNKRALNRRIYHRDRQGSNDTSRTSKGSLRSSGSTSKCSMEPENDIGAQPLRGNVVRRPSYTVSSAEASKMPFASVALVGSSFVAHEPNAASGNTPQHYSSTSISSLERARQNSYQRKFPPVSRASKTSFAGDIISTSRIRRRASSADPEEEHSNTKGNVSPSRTSAMSGTTTDSMEIGIPDSREISREFSVVANVVDEAQLEAEFEQRVRSRMVEAVEIRPSITEEEDPPIDNVNSNGTSYTTAIRNSASHCNTALSSTNTNTHSGSNSGSHDESNSHHSSARDGSVAEEAPEEKTPTSREIVRLRQRKRTIRCIIAWTSFAVVFTILIVVMVLFLKVQRIEQTERLDSSRLRTPSESPFFTPSASLTLDGD